MKNLPPPILAETWLFVVRNQNSYELREQQLHVRREIKRYFGSIELAQIYVDQSKGIDDSMYYI